MKRELRTNFNYRLCFMDSAYTVLALARLWMDSRLIIEERVMR